MKSLFILLLFSAEVTVGQLTRFENSGGMESATYFEAIKWYKNLDAAGQVYVKEMGDELNEEERELMLFPDRYCSLYIVAKSCNELFYFFSRCSAATLN